MVAQGEPGPRRALITGAAGFVGRHLRAHLEAAEWEVLGADLEGSDRVCDVSEPTSIATLLGEAGPLTHVFHLAAMAFVPAAMRAPIRAMEINLNGTIHLAQAMAEQHPKARLIYIGSAEVYGPPQKLPITEEHTLAPRNPYAISKAAADQFLDFFGLASGLDIVRLRPFNHTGPGQSDDYALSSFARQVAEAEAGLREAVIHVGNLSASRDFLHVGDVVRAYALAADAGQPGGVYNIASGTAVPLDQALEMLIDLSKTPVEVQIDPARMRPVEVPEVRGSYASLHQATGWQPEIPFTQIVTELLDFWREELKETTRST